MASVEFEPHDPAWFDRFEREQTRVERTVSTGLLDVFHIGSTAVPDLPAKPTLDAVTVFEDREAMAAGRDDLLEVGYDDHRNDPDWGVVTRTAGADDVTAGERDADHYGVCLHLRPRHNGTWCDQLVFRALLRDDVRARVTYDRAKCTAAATHPNDVDAYIAAKESTIASLVDTAYERGFGDQLPPYAPVERSRTSETHPR